MSSANEQTHFWQDLVLAGLQVSDEVGHRERTLSCQYLRQSARRCDRPAYLTCLRKASRSAAYVARARAICGVRAIPRPDAQRAEASIEPSVGPTLCNVSLLNSVRHTSTPTGRC